jgi:hypothetical protein
MLDRRKHRRDIDPVGPVVKNRSLPAKRHGKLGQGNLGDLSQGPKIEIFQERQDRFRRGSADRRQHGHRQRRQEYSFRAGPNIIELRRLHDIGGDARHEFVAADAHRARQSMPVKHFAFDAGRHIDGGTKEAGRAGEIQEEMAGAHGLPHRSKAADHLEKALMRYPDANGIRRQNTQGWA